MDAAESSARRYVDVNGRSIAVTDRGRGPVVVFLHGNPESRSAWDHIVAELGSFRCIALDLPGFGDSGLPADYDDSLDAQAEFFAAFVEALGLSDPFILVAHDIGALMAIPYAARSPDRIRGLLLMNTVFDPSFRWFFMARLWRHWLGGRLFMLVMNRFAFKRAFGSETTRSVARAHGDRIYDGLTRSTKASICRLYAKMTREGFFEPGLDDLHAVRQRATTRVLWGKNDGFIPLEHARRLSPGPRIVDNAGHWIPLERPDLVVEEIRALAGAPTKR